MFVLMTAFRYYKCPHALTWPFEVLMLGISLVIFGIGGYLWGILTWRLFQT